MKCEKCGSENESIFSFCNQCGEKLPQMVEKTEYTYDIKYCPDCGKLLPENKVCFNCEGVVVTDNIETSANDQDIYSKTKGNIMKGILIGVLVLVVAIGIRESQKVTKEKNDSMMESTYRTPMEILENIAKEENCSTGVVESNGFIMVEDDGSYFDEVVLGAWYNANGIPRAEYMPYTLKNEMVFSSKLSNFCFLNGQEWSMEDIMRAPEKIYKVFALILVDVEKMEDDDGYRYMVGYDFFTYIPVVIHGEFNGILNGDDLLVFAKYTGLASDDTPNFDGVYIEIINDKGLTDQ